MAFDKVVLDGDMSMSVLFDGDMSLDAGQMSGEFGVVTVPRDPSSTNYNLISNKPRIESVELIGNKSFEDLGLAPMSIDDLLKVIV